MMEREGVLAGTESAGHKKWLLCIGARTTMRDMKTNTTTKSMRRSLPVFAQIVHLIPAGLIERGAIINC